MGLFAKKSRVRICFGLLLFSFVLVLNSTLFTLFPSRSSLLEVSIEPGIKKIFKIFLL